ncbi:MAG: cytochrome c [Verrucomicrobia bacterium]|nr:cytochrome c [Verrucomicrobiota bacterium]
MSSLRSGWYAGACAVLGAVVLAGSWPPSGPPLYGQSAGSGQGESLRREGQKLFQTRCFVCHGLDGKGDGPAATGLGANPRNFTDPQWQHSTTDDRIRKVIKEGGEAVGESGAMPPNSDLSEAQVDALVAFLRSLNQT